MPTPHNDAISYKEFGRTTGCAWAYRPRTLDLVDGLKNGHRYVFLGFKKMHWTAWNSNSARGSGRLYKNGRDVGYSGVVKLYYPVVYKIYMKNPGSNPNPQVWPPSFSKIRWSVLGSTFHMHWYMAWVPGQVGHPDRLGPPYEWKY